jgi:hypothetical protein
VISIKIVCGLFFQWTDNGRTMDGGLVELGQIIDFLGVLDDF